VRQEFQRIIHLKKPSFEPEGLKQYIKDSSGIFNDETDEISDNIQLLINRFVITKLKNEYGEEHEKWWRLGIPKQIQKDCAIKAIETDPPEPPENFLLLLDYQKIVKDNWKLFGEFFTPPDMKQASKDDKIDWFVKYNTIRNKVKHPERQDVSESEYNFIKNLQNWITTRISL
jgi:DNA sulfur modification protein DndB